MRDGHDPPGSLWFQVWGARPRGGYCSRDHAIQSFSDSLRSHSFSASDGAAVVGFSRWLAGSRCRTREAEVIVNHGLLQTSKPQTPSCSGHIQGHSLMWKASVVW